MEFWRKLGRAWRVLRTSERDVILDQQDQFLAALERIAEHQTRQVEAVSGAITAQAQSFREYLSLFKTTGTPEGWTVRDEDEILSRNKWAKEAGLPEGMSAADELQWVLDNSGR